MYICIVSTAKKYRTIVTYKDYFEEFLKKQRQKVKEKIIWTFLLIEEVQQIPETYLKHLEGTDGLYEIRIQLGSEKGLTQEQLAVKCGTNKAYISKVENDIKDVRISTLQKIIEVGLGGRLNLSVTL